MKPNKNLKDPTEESVFKNIMEQLPGIIFRCRNNRNWSMLYINQASQLITGYTPDELIDDHSLAYASLIDAEDCERVWQEVQTALKQKQCYEIKYRINTKQGDQKWVWEKSFTRPLVEGDSSIIEGIVLDITQQHQTELALRAGTIRQNKILDGSIEGILIHRDCKPLFVNKSFVRMLGYDSYQNILTLESI